MRYELTSSTFGPEETNAMQEVIASGQFTMGAKVKAFEEAFAAYFGLRHAVMVNSGSSANLIAIASLFYRKDKPLRPGDEVIVPCLAWATTYYPLHQYGLKLRIVDIDLQTLNAQVDAVERAITPKTRLVVAVSILGNPAPLKGLAELCKSKGLILMEDNCESMGASLDGRSTGTFGLVNTFSTFYSHHISTMEGGLIGTDDHEVYNLLKSLRNHGWTRDQDPDSPVFSRRPQDVFETYRFILPGYNVRPGELHGAIGIEQLKKLKGFVEQRRANAAYFKEVFGGDNRFIFQQEHGRSSSFCFTFIVKPGLPYGRKEVADALGKAGIEYRSITGGNIARHDVVRWFDAQIDPTPNGDLVHDRGFFVGNHPRDLRAEIDLLHTALSRLPE